MSDVDPLRTLVQARELCDRGSFAEALHLYEWFHCHALEVDPSLIGVRLSLALRGWAELGARYTPALKGLKALRDGNAEALLNGNVDSALFEEVESIDSVLGQAQHTASLFSELAARDRVFANRCFNTALPALVAAGEFALARAFIPSAQDVLGRYIRRLDLGLRSLPASASDSEQLVRHGVVGMYVEDLVQLLQILNKVGEAVEAKHLLDVGINSVSNAEVREEVERQLAMESVVRTLRSGGKTESA